MNDYKSIFTIRLEHDYYMNNICHAIHLFPSSNAMSLMKRRSLMLKQTATNEWSIIGDCAGAGVFDKSDVLKLEMRLLESKFVYFTDWKNYQTKYAYHLDMPCEKNVVEANEEMQKTDIRRIGNVFCSVNIQLSNQMFEKAKTGNAESNTLLFHAPHMYWEYILVSRDKEANRNLKIEDNRNQIAFNQIKKIEIETFPYPVFRTITKSTIPMKEHYEFDLTLVEIIRENPLMKRVVIKYLQPPDIGVFFSEHPDIIREIRYY